jgi:adenylate cyclase
VKSAHLRYEGRTDEAEAEAEIALRLDPDSYEANQTAALVCFTQQRFAEAIPLFEKSAALMETDFSSPGMLVTCHTALGDRDGAMRAARMCLARCEATLTRDRGNGAALGFGASALGVLGEGQRTREWTQRALLMDPDNQTMRYNLACTLAVHVGDVDGALELLATYFARANSHNEVDHPKIDPDLDPLRGDPRFQAMLAEAEARVAPRSAGAS